MISFRYKTKYTQAKRSKSQPRVRLLNADEIRQFRDFVASVRDGIRPKKIGLPNV
jgi:hypothetical protein